ncbi:hypothetical protein [Fimbriiglobus ruber]|uniref:hypothetical protein n=1 Tax=Fimbriiglobus ruber TaxID=1908690 RepID=UPI00117AFE29|nr:hypothetical protein [Fimbriiglobus ruber]
MPAGLDQDVLHDDWCDDTDPELSRFDGQVAKRLAELRINVQAGVNFSDGGKDLGTQTDFQRPQNQIA